MDARLVGTESWIVDSHLLHHKLSEECPWTGHTVFNLFHSRLGHTVLRALAHWLHLLGKEKKNLFFLLHSKLCIWDLIQHQIQWLVSHQFHPEFCYFLSFLKSYIQCFDTFSANHIHFNSLFFLFFRICFRF